jgi:hypothetical protein
MIAPTKAMARYAVNTLSPLTKVMGKLPWLTSLPALMRQFTKPFSPQKVSAAVTPHGSTAEVSAHVVKDS